MRSLRSRGQGLVAYYEGGRSTGLIFLWHELTAWHKVHSKTNSKQQALISYSKSGLLVQSNIKYDSKGFTTQNINSAQDVQDKKKVPKVQTSDSCRRRRRENDYYY